MATKAQTKTKTKKHALKNTFLGVHGVCPELVNLFDYMVDQSTNGSRDVTLRDVEGYVENMVDAITQLIDIFDPDTALAEIEHLDEIDDLCC